VSSGGLIGGWAADALLGDPRSFHPVAGFGRLALALERRVYAPSRARGTLFAAALVGLSAAVGELAARMARRASLPRGLALAATLWGALGGRSLLGEADAIRRRLERGDLAGARERLPALVGRDVDGLGEEQVCRAVVESVAENTADAVVGTLLWGLLAGPAGVCAFRAANTLDAMVGHRNERYRAFGWAAARLDDLLVWPAARLGAALAVLCAPLAGGSTRRALATLRRDGSRHPSPNAGRMEAAFAGALGVRLGGPVSYGGRLERHPALGDGRPPAAGDIAGATRLSLAVGALAVLVASVARAAVEGGR
jgi:adenosylcobinamide-phosphate synthase